MIKFLAGLLLVFSAFTANAQSYNNEWVDFNKTYFRFKVGSNGLYRISQPSLASIGLANIPSEHFQLWHDGEEIPMFTSTASGLLGTSDFLEFYGEANDGKVDKSLYKYDSLQMWDKLSLYTDTAAYFLTVNNGVNKRIVSTANNVAGNILPAETGFMYTLQKNYKVKQNPGFAIDYGTLLYSSSYETGEGWTSSDVFPGSLVSNHTLQVDNSGGTATLSAVIAGNSPVLRTVRLKLNGSTLTDTLLNGYNIKRFHVTGIPLSLISSGSANVEFVNAGFGSDKIVVAGFELSYPHTFNFEGQSQFSFNLEAGAARYLEITNFNFGSAAPLLYDLTNRQRLTADMNGATIRFVLPATATAASYVLLNSEPANTKFVQQFTQRNFVNYALPQYQGDYVIISHPGLYNDGFGNNHVENYRAYRSSIAGGGYNAVVVDINEITDQFAFGVKHNPVALRNFGRYALTNFNVTPKYFYLIGKGLAYTEHKRFESDPNVEKLALIPTFGYPASDNLLFAGRTQSYSQVSMGRLSAISGTEVGDYLDKVKQFELAQVSGPQTIADKGWMKNVAQITGAIDDLSLSNLINFFMDGYKQILSDTSFGGNVYQFNKNSGQYTAVGSNKTIDDLFNEGLSYLTYFGHSSPNTLEFNLDNPQNYNNTGKYPLIMVNGCNTGNLYLFDTLRPVSKGTLSEKYVFATNKGGIGFIADTHFGLPQQLNFFTEKFDSNLSGQMYGQPIGDIMKHTMQYMVNTYTNDFASRIHAEEITYHGDPAIRLNPFTKPDYTIEDSLITFNPAVISVADERVTVTAKILNIGKAINDSITVIVKHQRPDNSIRLLESRRIKATLSEDTIQVQLAINPLLDKGTNSIIVTLDADSEVQELSETNNSISKEFEILDDEIRPVFPFNYAIVGNTGGSLELIGSTANPLAVEKEYVMELDTTMQFNSPVKVIRSVTDSGGAIRFVPGVILLDSTVYYWRLTTGPVTPASRWLVSSFTSISGSPSDGYAQAHYYQYGNNSFESIVLDSADRNFRFTDKVRKLFIRTGLAPYYGWDQINVNLDNDQLDLFGCTYSLQFVVYNPLTLQPWRNYNVNATEGRYRSSKVCLNSASSDTTRIFFEYVYANSNSRKYAMDFLDSIPAGYIVSVTNLNHISNTTFINTWKADTSLFGSGKSLWHKFHEMGMHQVDSFTSNRPFLFVFKKGDTVNFPVRQHVGAAVNLQIADTFLLSGKVVSGSIQSPWFGPAGNWKNFKWDTTASSPTNDSYFEIIGQMQNGDQNLLATVYSSKDTSLSFIDAAIYPKLAVRMHNSDPVNAIPAQQKYWMITSDNYPEGALSPNILFQCADTLNTSDSLMMRVAFKNISDVAFDSIKVRLSITGADGIIHVYENLEGAARIRPLTAGDTAIIQYKVPLSDLPGYNQLKLEVNPDYEQPEQYLFNNILYKGLYVNQTHCSGENISFSVPSFTGNKQWQVNTGSGYTDISDGPLYAGTQTSSLQIINPLPAMAGYRYRCAYTDNNTNAYSQEFVLKNISVWKGQVSTAWEDPSNWLCGQIPDEETDVIVKEGALNYPVISSNAVCKSISATINTSILVKAGFSLLVAGK